MKEHTDIYCNAIQYRALSAIFIHSKKKSACSEIKLKLFLSQVQDTIQIVIQKPQKRFPFINQKPRPVFLNVSSLNSSSMEQTLINWSLYFIRLPLGGESLWLDRLSYKLELQTQFFKGCKLNINSLKRMIGQNKNIFLLGHPFGLDLNIYLFCLTYFFF